MSTEERVQVCGSAQAISAQAQVTPDINVAALKKALIDSAIKMAAVQTGAGIILGLAAFYPIGTIIAAVLAIIQLFTSVYVKHKIKDIIANGVTDITRMTSKVQDELFNEALDAAERLYPGAQALAASNQPLDGVFDSFGLWFTRAMRGVAKPIAKPVGRGFISVPEYVGKGILQVGLAYAKLVGDKQFENKVEARYGKWDVQSKKMERAAGELAKDPVATIRFMHGAPTRALIGLSTEDDARKKVRALVADAAVKLPGVKASALAKIRSDEFQTALQLNMAKLIRKDPVALAKAADAQRIDDVAQNTMDRALNAAYAGQPTI